MKKLLSIFFIQIITFSVSFSQNTVKIITKYKSDTIKICSDTSITFYAVALNGTDTVKTGLDFYWDFDDNNFLQGTELDTVTHKFVVPRAYRVSVVAKNNNFYADKSIIVELGLDPYFTGTKTNVPNGQSGICKGESIDLIGKINNHKWKEKDNSTRNETFPYFIDYNTSYSSYITIKNFPPGTKISSANDIDSIGIKLEHSNTADIKIYLTCPTGKRIVLKDTGGVHKYFGEPVVKPGDYDEGTGYWYYWTNSPTYGEMNKYTGSDTLPSATYTSDSSFSKLIGCPMNGNWTISVDDSMKNSDNGYIFAWQLKLNKNLQDKPIEYGNIYNLSSAFWDGDGANVTSNAIGDARPLSYGTHTYILTLFDNFGCVHDTSLSVNVEKANFDIDKNTVIIGDSIHLTDKTSWAKYWEWDFGDQSGILNDKEEYKKYEEKGHYTITMTVTSNSGCTDEDTAIVSVIPEPIKITGYNIFTPNGDGINDVFKFFNTPEEKIVAANIDQIEGRIYNRYGQIVCKWNTAKEILKGWDGTMKNRGGRKAPAGFYYYVLIIKGKDGIKYKPFSGFIYLYR
jgi:gliding motility-associated-like protein